MGWDGIGCDGGSFTHLCRFLSIEVGTLRLSITGSGGPLRQSVTGFPKGGSSPYVGFTWCRLRSRMSGVMLPTPLLRHDNELPWTWVD